MESEALKRGLTAGISAATLKSSASHNISEGQAILTIIKPALPSLVEKNTVAATVISQNPEGRATIEIGQQRFEVQISNNNKLAKSITLQVLANGQLLLNKDSPELSGSSASAKNLTQLLLNSAISKAERELLKRFFGLSENAELAAAQKLSEGTSTNFKFPYSSNSAKTEADNTNVSKLLSAINIQSSDNKESELALRIIKNILVSKQDTPTVNKEDPKIKLLKLLESIQADNNISGNLKSEIVAAIKTQSAISPEMRATLLQSMLNSSNADVLLMEQFLARRSDIVSAKREVLAILEKLLQSGEKAAVIEQLSSDHSSAQTLQYLMLLLNESAEKLKLIEDNNPEETLLKLLFASKVKLPIDLTSATAKQTNLEPTLVAALQIDDIITQLSENLGSKVFEEFNQKTASIYSKTLRETLKNLLIPKLENPASEQLQNLSASEPLIKSLNTDDITDIITSELSNKLTPGAVDTQPSSEQSRLLAKILIQSNLSKELLLKMEQALLNNHPIAAADSRLSADISEITLSALTLAVELKSAQMFRASSQFLRSSLANKDLISAMTSLLIPLLDIYSSSLDDNSANGQSHIKALYDQIDNLKSSYVKREINSKEVALQIIKNVSNLLDNFENYNSRIDRSKAEQQLIENLSKESLNRLNNLAEQMHQANLSSINLQSLGGSALLEIKTQPTTIKIIDDEESNDKDDEVVGAAETIECSVILPNLGECGISFTIWDKQISLNICNQSQAIIESALPLVSQLESRLHDLSFDKARIELNCSKPKSVKPGWLLEFLGSKKQA